MDLNQIVAAIGGTAGIVAFLKEGYRLYRWHIVNRADFVAEKEWEIYKELNLLMQKTNASKVLMLSTHNGGDKVQAGKRLYSSVTHEVNGSKMPVTANDWKKQLIDESYTKLLLKMLSHPRRKVFLFTDEIPDELGDDEKELAMKVSGSLKNVYKNQEIDHTIVFHVYTYTPKIRPWVFFQTANSKMMGKMWYVSLVFKDKQNASYKELDTIRVVRNRIRTILNEQYRYD